MNILVCIKESMIPGEINRFDTFALEQALLIKEEFGGNPVIDVAALGPPSAEKIIRRAFGLGADNGIHILSSTKMTLAAETASTLLGVAQKNNYDLILTGIMSEDMMAGQTGPMLARMLGRPCATGVVKTQISDAALTVRVEREMEHGFRDCLEIELPCVLAIQAGSNIPRYPTLSKMLAASEKKIDTILQKELISSEMGSGKTQISFNPPEKTRAGKFLEGSLAEKVNGLKQYLKNKDLL